MSVSLEYAKQLEKLSIEKWNTFDAAKKMQKTLTYSVEEADLAFSKANAYDKHLMTI